MLSDSQGSFALLTDPWAKREAWRKVRILLRLSTSPLLRAKADPVAQPQHPIFSTRAMSVSAPSILSSRLPYGTTLASLDPELTSLLGQQVPQHLPRIRYRRCRVRSIRRLRRNGRRSKERTRHRAPLRNEWIDFSLARVGSWSGRPRPARVVMLCAGSQGRRLVGRSREELHASLDLTSTAFRCPPDAAPLLVTSVFRPRARVRLKTLDTRHVTAAMSSCPGADSPVQCAGSPPARRLRLIGHLFLRLLVPC